MYSIAVETSQNSIERHCSQGNDWKAVRKQEVTIEDQSRWQTWHWSVVVWRMKGRVGSGIPRCSLQVTTQPSSTWDIASAGLDVRFTGAAGIGVSLLYLMFFVLIIIMIFIVICDDREGDRCHYQWLIEFSDIDAAWARFRYRKLSVRWGLFGGGVTFCSPCVYCCLNDASRHREGLQCGKRK